MSGRFWRSVATGCICVIAAPSMAQAQSNQVAAEALFREARTLLEQGQYQQACEKLAASNRLDPAAGTLLNLARCREKTGQIATAWATYHEAVTVAKATGQVEREKTARESAAALEPLLPKLTIVVSPEARVGNPQIRRDGVPVPPELWGVTLPMDPGEHIIEANAPGKQRWVVKTSVRQRETAIITVPPLEATPGVAPSASSVGTASPPATSAPKASTADGRNAEPSDGTSNWSGAKTAALIVAGVGVAGLVVGGIEWAKFEHNKDEADKICPGGACFEPEHSAAVSFLDEAHNARTIGIVAGAAGGVALVGAAILWFTAPTGATGKNRVTLLPSTTGRDLGLSLGGAW